MVGVEDFLMTLKNTRSSPRTAPSIIGNTASPVATQLGQRTGGFKFKSPIPGADANYGALLSDSIATRRTNSPQFQTNWNNENVTNLASDVISKSAGQIQTNQWGIPDRKKPDFNTSFKNHLQSITDRGELAAQAEEARSAWRNAKNAQDLAAYNIIPGTTQVYDSSNLPAGSNSKNPGGRAVALAMTAYKNGTPYVWGGNSLTGGVDCSGLVQQVYARLGVKVPRTTYEQAKSGKVVSLNSLLPGDLIFYNTGSRDPNGIGNLSHVAIYTGNGRVVQAYNTKQGIKVTSINYAGRPVRAVRPW